MKQVLTMTPKNINVQPVDGKKKKKIGLVRDLNPGPPAPEARIIPLDQRAVIGEEGIIAIFKLCSRSIKDFSCKMRCRASPGFEPGTSAPEARIIPLDQRPVDI